VDIKYDGNSYHIGQIMWDTMCAQAAERGMTIDEYVAEAFLLLKEKKLLKEKEQTSDLVVHTIDHSQTD